MQKAWDNQPDVFSTWIAFMPDTEIADTITAIFISHKLSSALIIVWVIPYRKNPKWNTCPNHARWSMPMVVQSPIGSAILKNYHTINRLYHGCLMIVAPLREYSWRVVSREWPHKRVINVAIAMAACTTNIIGLFDLMGFLNGWKDWTQNTDKDLHSSVQ